MVATALLAYAPQSWEVNVSRLFLRPQAKAGVRVMKEGLYESLILTTTTVFLVRARHVSYGFGKAITVSCLKITV